MENESKFKQT